MCEITLTFCGCGFCFCFPPPLLPLGSVLVAAVLVAAGQGGGGAQGKEGLCLTTTMGEGLGEKRRLGALIIGILDPTSTLKLRVKCASCS